MFDEQIKKGISNDNEEYIQDMNRLDNNEFDRIFSMSTSK